MATRWASANDDRDGERDDGGRGSRLAVGAAAVAALPLAWAAYSALVVDHGVPLPNAINAPRRLVRGERAGLLSYYADDADGAADRTPVVLLHSVNAAASAYEMRPLFDRLRGRRPVYALDLPGFGFSERTDRAYTPALYATAVVEFLDAVLPDGAACDLVALSLAGEFAAMAATRVPARVRSLALIAPTGLARPGQRSSGGQARAREGGSPTALRLLSARPVAQPLFDALVSRPSIAFFLGRSFRGPVDVGMVDYAYATAHQPGARFAPLAFVSGRLFTPDVRERSYAAVRAPALVLHDDAPYGGFGALPALTARHPNWQGVRIGDTRGLPQFERPEATVAALASFWATRPGAGATDAMRVGADAGVPNGNGI